MSKTPRLTEKEKGLIEAYKEEGNSNCWIANKIGRNESTIRYYFKNKRKERKKRGPKPKLSNATKRRIIRKASNKVTSLTKIKAEMNLNVSKETIRTVLKNNRNINFQKINVKPPLKSHHKQARLDWAKDKITWAHNWQDVTWSDEKKFNLDGPDGFAYHWHDLRKEKLVFSKRHSGGGSLMIWGCFNFHGKSRLAFVSKNQNQFEYQRHLRDNLLPFLDEFGGADPIFQQDNCRCHVARTTLQWFVDRNIQVMTWPAYSPDLNPIENLWGILTRRVYEGGRQYNSIDELKNAVIHCWEEIEKDTLEKLINSMPKRVYDVIFSRGGTINY